MTDLLPEARPLAERDPHQLPWPGREISAGGVTLHVRETPGPDGVPAVYVHGLAGSSTNWTDLAGLLSTRASGTAVDLPGFGRTPPSPRQDWSPAAHADTLMCFLAGLGERVHLLGNSLGGAIAISVAARRPELVETLTLVSPAMPDLRPDPRRISDPKSLLASVPGPIGARARAELAAMTPRQRAESILALVFGDPSLATERRIQEVVDEFAERGGQRWSAEAVNETGKRMIASWIRRPSLWATAARVQAPTLVVWGDRDKLMAPRLARRTAKVLRARLLMLEGVGHVAQIEAPEAVARGVADMWDAVASRAREDVR